MVEEDQIELFRSFLAAFGRPGSGDAATRQRRQDWIAADEAGRLAWLGLTREQAIAMGYELAAKETSHG